MPLEDNYFIIETDASKVGWGAILKQKPNKYSPKADKKYADMLQEVTN